MKTIGKNTLILLVTLLLGSTSAVALEAKPVMTPFSDEKSGSACHPLMMERECATFHATLASLPIGKTRDQFLAGHFALIRERESACSCNRHSIDTTTINPRVVQVARRF